MSEHFTHIAVFEDCARLIQYAPAFTEAFKSSLRNFYDNGLLGSTSRGNHLFAVPILEKWRDLWKDESLRQEAEIKIAYALGWILHRASDEQMKPLLRAVRAENHPVFNDFENSVYHDAMSFRMVYGGGSVPSASANEYFTGAVFDYNLRSHPAAGAVAVSRIEPLLNRMWQRELLETNLFVEQENDFGQWLEKLLQVYPKFSEDFRAYEAAFQDPDPVKVKKYYDHVNWYDERDDLLQLVRSLQRGESPTVDLATALERARTQSQYAQAIAKGYDYVRAASDFFDYKLDKEVVYDATDMPKQFRF